ncbi:MAG: ribosome biogenesis protein [Euryarchaeota archaeon]|nr:ribosome biogenesis protein [Euryarchaeota archaeon]|tara:strand:- start:1421 stop:1582 length:162 start_codon:yes stop_codon:yes gene_type:complete
MRSTILICKKCNAFTLELFCIKCGIQTSNPLPPKFSPEDKYGKYRRMLKEKFN